MKGTHELLRTGENLRVTLPDVLPPDWDTLEKELDRTSRTGDVRLVTIVPPRHAVAGELLDTVFRLATFMGRRGVRVGIERAQPSEPPCT